jgi:hypothetical protein
MIVTENQTGDAAVVPGPARAPFPAVRLIYAIAYGLVGWFVLHLVFALALVQFIVVALKGRANDELKAFSLNLIQYLGEILAFVTQVRDEQPFPIGPFPRQG